MKRVNFVSLDFLTLQWFCNTLQTQHPQTQAAKELYDALEALYAGKSDSLMLELGEAIPEAASTSLVCGNLLIDSKSRRVIRDGAEIQLTPKEFDILYFLARNRGEVFTKEQIYQAVWAVPPSGDNTHSLHKLLKSFSWLSPGSFHCQVVLPYCLPFSYTEWS